MKLLIIAVVVGIVVFSGIGEAAYAKDEVAYETVLNRVGEKPAMPGGAPKKLEERVSRVQQEIAKMNTIEAELGKNDGIVAFKGDDKYKALLVKDELLKEYELVHEQLLGKQAGEMPLTAKTEGANIEELRYHPKPDDIEGFPEYVYKDRRLVQMTVYEEPQPTGDIPDRPNREYGDARLIKTINYWFPKPYTVHFYSSDLNEEMSGMFAGDVPEGSLSRAGCIVTYTVKIEKVPTASAENGAENDNGAPKNTEQIEGNARHIKERISRNRASLLKFINGADEDEEI